MCKALGNDGKRARFTRRTARAQSRAKTKRARGEKRAKITRRRGRGERLFKLGDFPLRGLGAKLFGAAPHQRERRRLYIEAELRRLTRGAQRAHGVFGEMCGRCRADDFSSDVRGSAVGVDYAPLVVHRHAVYRRVAADEVLPTTSTSFATTAARS